MRGFYGGRSSRSYASAPTSGERIVVDIQDVLYSQSTISQVFDGGEPLADVAAAIKAGRMQASTLPPIRVLLHGGTYYSLDNRRLWVLKHSGVTSITVLKVGLAPGSLLARGYCACLRCRTVALLGHTMRIVLLLQPSPP